MSNFLGWYLTVFVIYQVFAIYARQDHTLPAGYWLVAVAFYGVSAAGNLLIVPGVGFRGIGAASAVVSVLGMGGIAMLCWAGLKSRAG